MYRDNITKVLVTLEEKFSLSRTTSYRTRARTPKPTAAAPVRALTLVESAAPVEAAAAAPAEVEEEVGVELEGEVAVGLMVGVLVSVTPTLLQIACEYASAFARS